LWVALTGPLAASALLVNASPVAILVAAIAGAVVQHAGVRWALAAATGCAVAGYLIAHVRHRSLSGPAH
jgi:hypothetical protein